MLKLYKFENDKKLYWETWENEGEHTVHWGALGTKGKSKEIRDTKSKTSREVIQKEIDVLVEEGYRPIEDGDHYILLIEYAVGGFGTEEDLDKRHRLGDRMNETLGWTGLGHNDGGSTGSGTMECCCFVVDFEIAKKVIEEDLKGTEFANYTRIYDEGAE